MHENQAMRDWADIRLFLAIVDNGSLVGAAESLELTQPTVGRRLAAMEERFATPLFVRSGRRMQLTDAGNGILESARRMEREMLAIGRNLDAQSSALCGEVTLSATEGTGTEWLTPVLMDFHRKYPEILVKVQIENRAVDLVHREADIALRLGEPTQANLIARRLVSIGFGFYASPAYLAESPPISELEDLSQHKFVSLDTKLARVSYDLAFSPDDVMLGQPSYLTNSPSAQLAAVKAGFGIGVLSHRWAMMADGLQRILPHYNSAEIDLWLVTHEELRYSARMKVMFDYIAERVIADKTLFESGAA